MTRRKGMKKLVASVTVATLCFGLAACGGGSNSKDGESKGEKQAEEKVVVVANTSEPVHFNGDAVSTAGGYPSVNIFSSLFDLTVTGKVIPDLVEDYTVAEDGMTYTFKLHDNVKWHDGEEFSAEDVKFTMDTIISEKGMTVDYLQGIDTIECPDENTVVLNMKQKSSSLINILPQIQILPKHIYEGTDWLENDANQNPIGTGPFKFVSWDKGVSITLEANDDYFGGRPEIDKLVYKTIPDENTVVQAFLNNEVDIVDIAAAISPSAMPSLESAEETNIETIISADRQYMVTNMQKEPWNNLKVREALALAIDRKEIVEKAHKGYAEVAEGFYTPAVEWAYNGDYTLPEKDVEKANQLLDEAGYEADGNGIRMKDVEIVIFQFAVFSDMASIVQANLKELGIECKITTLEYAAWEERMAAGEFDIGLIGGYHGPDPEVMRIRIGADGLLNYMKYNNPEIENIFAEGSQETDQIKRAEIYGRMQEILSQDLPIIPLSEWCYIAVTKDYIDGHYAYETESVGSGDYSTIKVKE